MASRRYAKGIVKNYSRELRFATAATGVPTSETNICLLDMILVYNARDAQGPSDRADRVYEIASLIVSWPRKLEVSRNIGKELYELATISNFLLPFDSSKPLSELLTLPMNFYLGTTSQHLPLEFTRNRYVSVAVPLFDYRLWQ